jgi:hypothetical protein
MTPVLDPRVTAFVADTCVFCQPWWLEAVAPGCWDIAVAWRGDEVAGVWPYAFKVRLGRYRLLEQPELSFYLGPWLLSSSARSARRLREEKDLMTELHDALPEFASFRQWFHPRVTNWMPLQWKGFSQTTRYTYLTPKGTDLAALWDETETNIRTDVRKARKELDVVEGADVEEFLELQRLTYERQGMALPFSEGAFRRLDAACAERGCRTILIARDSTGRPHAAAYLVRDSTTLYSFLRARDPEMKRGASALVLWAAIERASAEGRAFDFVGSWEEHIERFVRAFGGRQTPFFEVKKTKSRLVCAYRLLWKLRHRRG